MKDKWIHMKKETPFPGQRVIATDLLHVDIAIWDMINWCICDSGGISELSLNDIKYWKPLPSPPKEKP